jgi:hypothetical protein
MDGLASRRQTVGDTICLLPKSFIEIKFASSKADLQVLKDKPCWMLINLWWLPLVTSFPVRIVRLQYFKPVYHNLKVILVNSAFYNSTVVVKLFASPLSNPQVTGHNSISHVGYLLYSFSLNRQH